jgi:hypothetical protein
MVSSFGSRSDTDKILSTCSWSSTAAKRTSACANTKDSSFATASA